jgi:hypothetical protein
VKGPSKPVGAAEGGIMCLELGEKQRLTKECVKEEQKMQGLAHVRVFGFSPHPEDYHGWELSQKIS